MTINPAQKTVDKLYKLRPLIDYLKKRLMEIKSMEKLCNDEQIVTFKAKSVLKQCNPQKSKNWGYKLYILSGVDGLIYNFKVHIGVISIRPSQPDLKVSRNIVLIFFQNIPRMK